MKRLPVVLTGVVSVELHPHLVALGVADWVEVGLGLHLGVNVLDVDDLLDAGTLLELDVECLGVG